MERSLLCGLLAFTIMVGQVGCARTVVRKNPDARDEGLRFYRSKPYLLIAPKDGDTTKVTISMQYMPDFSEEYSVQAYTGLIGTNKTEVLLNEAGVLTALNVDVDSKASEFVDSVANLIGALPKPTDNDRSAPSSVKSEGVAVKAYRVPLGYYEAVVSRGPDCKKHLYGWRYVGFAPFNKCPLESTGLDCMECHSSELFGLVVENDTMVFKRIDELAHDTVTVTAANAKPSDDVLQGQIEERVNAFLTSQGALPAGGIKAEIDSAAKSVSFTSSAPITGVRAEDLETKMKEIVTDVLAGYTVVNNT